MISQLEEMKRPSGFSIINVNVILTLQLSPHAGHDALVLELDLMWTLAYVFPDVWDGGTFRPFSWIDLPSRHAESNWTRIHSIYISTVSS